MKCPFCYKKLKLHELSKKYTVIGHFKNEDKLKLFSEFSDDTPIVWYVCDNCYKIGLEKFGHNRLLVNGRIYYFFNDAWRLNIKFVFR